MNSSRVAAALASVCLAGAVLRYGFSPIAGYDVFWHVATGVTMLEQGSLLPRDPFSYVGGGAPWPYKDAGAAIVMALLYRAGGFGALVVAKALVFLGAVATLGVALLRHRRVPWPVAALVLAVFVEASAFRFTERPQSVALAGTALAVLLLERHRAGRGRLVWVVPLTLLLANVHRGALVLPLVVLAYAVGTVIDARGLPPTAGERRELLAAPLGAALACLATPFGVAILSTSRALLSDEASRNIIPEWSPTTSSSALAASPATIAFAAIGALALASRGRRQSARDLALVLLGVALGLRAVRFLPYFPLLGAVPVAAALGELRPLRAGVVGNLVGVGASAIATLLALGSGLPPPHLGLEASRNPHAALEWARRAGVQGNPLNDFRFGGYLIFCCHPPYSVYIDGRNDLVYSAEHLRRAASILTDPKALEEERRRYGFEWILALAAPEEGAYGHLDRNPEWALVYQSQAAVLYLHTTGPNADLAKRAAYRRLRAFDLHRSILEGLHSPDEAERRLTVEEVQRMLREDPESYYARLAMAVTAAELRPASPSAPPSR